MCAAVALDPDSVLLIMHANTYNAVLRQYHYRHKQLSSATSLLSELPLFKTFTYSKVASIAYTMTNQTYSAESTLAKFGEPIRQVLLIVQGQVKTYAAPFEASQLSRDVDIGKLLLKRIPKLAVALLGRGQIIGEAELHAGKDTFQHTYISSSSTTEVLLFPVDVFKESLSQGVDEKVLQTARDQAKEKETRQASRLSRATEVIKSMVGNTDFREVKTKSELMNLLPAILDPQVPQEAAPVVVYRRPIAPALSSSPSVSPRGGQKDHLSFMSSMHSKADDISEANLASTTLKNQALSAELKKSAMRPPIIKTQPPPTFRSPRKIFYGIGL